MRKRNYQKELDQILEEQENSRLLERYFINYEKYMEFPGAEIISSQLLRPLQQLCTGIFIPVLSDYPVLLQSQYLSGRGIP